MKPNKSRLLFYALNILILVSLAVSPIHAAPLIAVTGGSSSSTVSTAPVPAGLKSFIDTVKNGSGGTVTGLYVESEFSFPVIQQPTSQPAYVSPYANQVTQFAMASSYGSLGFLAHNNLAGSSFSSIKVGDVITVVYGDGHYSQYQVSSLRSLRALQPSSPYSSFIDLATNQTLSATDVFYQTYGVKNQLVLQTCISSQGLDSWGRLFVTAVPYTPVPYKSSIPVFLSASV